MTIEICDKKSQKGRSILEIKNPLTRNLTLSSAPEFNPFNSGSILTNEGFFKWWLTRKLGSTMGKI